MEKYLSERVKNLATSQTLAMAAKARELRSSGKDVIGLSLGEPDFNIPDFIKFFFTSMGGLRFERRIWYH